VSPTLVTSKTKRSDKDGLLYVSEVSRVQAFFSTLSMKIEKERAKLDSKTR